MVEEPRLLGRFQAPKKDLKNSSIPELMEKEEWQAVMDKIRQYPLQAEEDQTLLTRGGFTAQTGFSLLHFACERHPPEAVVRLLIESYPVAVLTRCMPGGCLPLHIACTWGASFDVVEALLSADPGTCKVKDELGNVPLHSACFAGAPQDIVDALILADRDSVIARNHQGSQPIDIVKRLRHDNRRQILNCLTIYKEELLAMHRRSRSSGTFAEISRQAHDLNERYGTPTDDQPVEVTYQEEETELVWI